MRCRAAVALALVALPLLSRGAALPQTIAVLPFRDLAAGTGSSPIGEALRETVTADLKELSGLRIIERGDLDKILSEQKLQAQRADLDPSTAARVGKLLGATLLVAGAYQRAEHTVRLTARVVRVESGEIIGAAKVDGKEAELLRLQDRVTSELLRSAGLQEKARRTLSRARPALKSLKVFELYGQAVQEPDDLQRYALLKLAAAEDSAFVYAANDLRALELRLRRYQRDDEAARAADIADLTRSLAAAQGPDKRAPILMALLIKLQQAGRYRQLEALSRTALVGDFVPAPSRELPGFYLILSEYKLREKEAVLRDGEDYLKRFPGSAYFSGVKQLVEQTITDIKKAEEGRSTAAEDAAKVPSAQRWDLCQLAQIYRRHHQLPEEGRLLRACLAVGKTPRALVLRDLVQSMVGAGNFAQARRDLAELERIDGEAARTLQKSTEIPTDG